jgi:hypothetical protein
MHISYGISKTYAMTLCLDRTSLSPVCKKGRELFSVSVECSAVSENDLRKLVNVNKSRFLLTQH